MVDMVDVVEVVEVGGLVVKLTVVVVEVVVVVVVVVVMLELVVETFHLPALSVSTVVLRMVTVIPAMSRPTTANPTKISNFIFFPQDPSVDPRALSFSSKNYYFIVKSS